MEIHDYAMEFGKVALAHLLAVMSPGPDFAVVLRQSLGYGRRIAIWTSVGIGTAILLHVTYSLLGIGLLITGSPEW
ncbi:MAG TPA: LysE family transporter, partial [Opitutus sp.]|nr:LysE family transporter [Opitutus sp.]